jgi:hypothetical protein
VSARSLMLQHPRKDNVPIRIRPLVALATLLFAACGGRVPPPAAAPGAPASAAAVERFLQLAGEKDYVQMGWVFGTEQGPVITRHPLPEVEKRMYALANLLQHTTFELGDGSPVPGRSGVAESFNVRIQTGGGTKQVPFVAVRGPDGRWFVERVSVEAITNVR